MVDCCVACDAPLLPHHPHSFVFVFDCRSGWLLCSISVHSGRDGSQQLFYFFALFPSPFRLIVVVISVCTTPAFPLLHSDWLLCGFVWFCVVFVGIAGLYPSRRRWNVASRRRSFDVLQPRRWLWQLWQLNRCRWHCRRSWRHSWGCLLGLGWLGPLFGGCRPWSDSGFVEVYIWPNNQTQNVRHDKCSKIIELFIWMRHINKKA